MKPTHIIASGKTRKFDGQMEAIRPLQLISFSIKGDGVFIDANGGTITCPIRPEFVLPYPHEEQVHPMNIDFDNRPMNIVFFAWSKFIEEVWNFDPIRFNLRPLP